MECYDAQLQSSDIYSPTLDDDCRDCHKHIVANNDAILEQT